MKAHVSDYKKSEVERVEKLLRNYKVIAVADMTNMPSVQLQRLRSKLKGNVLITMSKKRLIKIALRNLKDKIKNIDQLEQYVKGMPALLLTNESPFKLSFKLKKSKSKAPAKGGQTAPNDIIVPAGPTAFPPGPIIGELGQIGLKATIAEGKVTIKEDATVVKGGNEIYTLVAAMLTRLGIEPMEIGITLVAALEEGTVYNKEILSVDETQYLNNIKLAALNSFNLAFNIAYTTKENIKLLLTRAFRNGNAIAESRKIMTSETVKNDLGKAQLEMESLKSKLNLPDDMLTNGDNDASQQPSEETAEVKKKLENVEEKKETINQAHQIPKEEPKIDGFKKDEEIAQSVLKKLQDEKLEKAEKEARKPRWAL